MTTVRPVVPPLAAFLRPELPAAALTGFPGEVATALAEASGADPAAILLAFLALLGNATGPQPHARFGGAEHPARLFVVLVGDAATGRKGTAFGAVEALFTEADPDWADGRVLYGLQSAEAMIDLVDDNATDCRLMVVETEFARMVETMARTGTLSAQLRNAWDGRTLQRTTTRFVRRASRAHISLLGMITPEELLRHHKRLSQAGGLESRILYVYTAPLREVSPFAAPADTAALVSRLRQILEASRETVMGRSDPISRYLLAERGIQPRTELPVDPGITGNWEAVKSVLAEHSRGGMPGLHSRAESQVIRLAAAYALADMAGSISAQHIEAAIAVQSYTARSAEIVFGVPIGRLPPRVNPGCAARIIRHLHDNHPEWVSREELGSTALHGSVPAREVTAAIADLTAKRLIERRRDATTGADQYRLVPPQLSLFDE
jgi:hypothetical protein